MSRQFSSIWFWFSALALAILAVFLLYPLLNVLTGSIGSGGVDHSDITGAVDLPRRD